MKQKRQGSIIVIMGLLTLALLFLVCLFLMQGERRREYTISMDTELGLRPQITTGERGDMAVRRVAITFDDGPHPTCTPMLLEGLKERGVKASFFITGENAERYPKLVKQIAKEGHLIGNHTYHHTNLQNASKKMIEEEVVSANEVIKKITGEPPQFIRPPFGACQEIIEEQTGLLCVLWTIDPLDWCTMDADRVTQKVVTNAKENDIILLHDEYETSVTAALRIIDILQEKGFEFVTVDEILLD